MFTEDQYELVYFCLIIGVLLLLLGLLMDCGFWCNYSYNTDILGLLKSYHSRAVITENNNISIISKEIFSSDDNKIKALQMQPDMNPNPINTIIELDYPSSPSQKHHKSKVYRYPEVHIV